MSTHAFSLFLPLSLSLSLFFHVPVWFFDNSILEYFLKRSTFLEIGSIHQGSFFSPTTPFFFPLCWNGFSVSQSETPERVQSHVEISGVNLALRNKYWRHSWLSSNEVTSSVWSDARIARIKALQLANAIHAEVQSLMVPTSYPSQVIEVSRNVLDPCTMSHSLKLDPIESHYSQYSVHRHLRQ